MDSHREYGKLIQTTDARGFVTVFTYGSVGGFDIYPTQTEIAYGTSFERTEMHAEISVSNFNGGGRVTSVTVQPLEKKK